MFIYLPNYLSVAIFLPSRVQYLLFLSLFLRERLSVCPVVYMYSEMCECVRFVHCVIPLRKRQVKLKDYHPIKFGALRTNDPELSAYAPKAEEKRVIILFFFSSFLLFFFSSFLLFLFSFFLLFFFSSSFLYLMVKVRGDKGQRDYKMKQKDKR